jgi:hypothetical protein
LAQSLKICALWRLKRGIRLTNREKNNMKITAADVGRKVVLRNGRFDVLTEVKINHCATPNRVYWIDGRFKEQTLDPTDIIAFADEPEVKQDTSTKTLRDEFAMAALTGLLACHNSKANDPETVAEHCYAAADAMMAAREGKTNAE